ncbi:MAG TPA: hypothetical protein VMW05_03665 [Methyloceanibacter sp.]|nr:hypothetical protein [Methyloceanibacter sp.]
MKSPVAIGVVIGCVTVFTSVSLLAAETRSWPWMDKAPVDPALALLSKVETLKVAITGLKKTPTLNIMVEAQAPGPGFTEVKLTPRMGDPRDLIFAFDVRGRRPQEMSSQVLTPVAINVEYTDAPLASVGIVEVYAKENCKAFNLKDKTEAECTMNPGSQDIP